MRKAKASWRSWGMVIPILLWVCSFFLPAITFPPDNMSHWAPAQGTQRGYEAALLSLTAGVVSAVRLLDAIPHGFSWGQVLFSLDGLLWLANLSMILMLFREKSLLQGRSTLLLITMWFWVAAPLPLAWQSFQRGPDGLRPFTLHIGFLLWWFSLLVMASICMVFRGAIRVDVKLPVARQNRTDLQV